MKIKKRKIKTDTFFDIEEPLKGHFIRFFKKLTQFNRKNQMDFDS